MTGSLGHSRYTFRRILVDEVQERPSTLYNFHCSDIRWAVTGTPVSQSFSELVPVLKWLGQGNGDGSGDLRINVGYVKDYLSYR